MPKELVSKRNQYLEIPRSPYDVLRTDKYDNLNGKLFNPDYVSKRFKKLLKQNNLKHIRFHDLRHSCAALLLSEGRELYDVKEWLGHSDINITAKYYGHLDLKRKRALGNSIGNSIGFKTVV